MAQTGLEIVLKHKPLPAEPTEIEGIIAAMERMEPKQKILSNYISRKKDFLSADEIERPKIFDRLKQRVSQFDTGGIYWISGFIQLGQYDTAQSRFPIIAWSFDRREDRIFIKNVPSDQSKFQYLTMNKSEAEFLLSEIPEKRIMNVLLKAKLFGWASLDGNAGDLSATTYFDVLQQIIWLPNRSKTGNPLIVASGNPVTQITSRSEDYAIAKAQDKPFVLDQESIAVMLHKHDPSLIDDSIIVQMILNRWILERRRPKYKMYVNSWPKFFDSNHPSPNVAEIIRLIPEFRKWIAQRSNEISNKVGLRVSMSSFPHDDCTSFGRVSESYSLSESDKYFLEGLISDEEYKNTFSDINNQRNSMKSGNFYKFGPMYFGMPTHNLVFANSSVENYTQDFCKDYPSSGSLEWKKLRNSLPLTHKPRNYPIGIVKIPEFTTDITQKSNFWLEASIKSTEVIKQKDNRAKLYITLEPNYYASYDFSAGNQTAEAVKFASKEQVDAAIILTDQPKTNQASQSRVFGSVKQDHSYDVIGIRPGMTLDEADAIINSHFTTGKKLSFRPKPDSPPFTVFTKGTVYASDKFDDYLILVHDERLFGNRVLAVGRIVYSGPNSIDAKALVDRIQEKYNAKRHVDYEGSVFQGASVKGNSAQSAEPCYLQVGNMGNKLKFYENDSEIDTRSVLPPDLRKDIASIDWFPWIGFQDKMLNNLPLLAKCNPTAAIWVPFNQGLTASFVAWVADSSEYSKQMISLMNNNISNTPQRRVPKL